MLVSSPRRIQARLLSKTWITVETQPGYRIPQLSL